MTTLPSFCFLLSWTLVSLFCLCLFFLLVYVSADFPCFGNRELAMVFLPIAHMEIGIWLAWSAWSVGLKEGYYSFAYYPVYEKERWLDRLG